MEQAERGAMQALIDRVDLDALATEVVLRLAREIPGHARLSEEIRWGRLYPELRALLGNTMRDLAGGAVAVQADLGTVEQAARERAAQGMPLEDILRVHRIGSRMCWDALRAAAGPDDADTLMTAAESIMTFTDTASAAVARAYLDERDSRISEQERTARRLLEAIDAGAPITGEPAALADTFDLLRRPDYLPFVIRVVGGNAWDHAGLAATVRDLGSLALSEGDRVIGVVAGDRALPTLQGHSDRLVLAPGSAVGRGDVETMLRQLRAVADVAARTGRTGIVDIAQFGPEVLVELLPHVGDALVERIMGPLSDELRQTLVTWTEHDFDRGRTSASLHLHRNTLLYRLGRVSALTGLRLDEARDRTAIYLACARMASDDVRLPAAPVTRVVAVSG
jgi:hypothetical protein